LEKKKKKKKKKKTKKKKNNECVERECGDLIVVSFNTSGV